MYLFNIPNFVNQFTLIKTLCIISTKKFMRYMMTFLTEYALVQVVQFAAIYTKRIEYHYTFT